LAINYSRKNTLNGIENRSKPTVFVVLKSLNLSLLLNNGIKYMRQLRLIIPPAAVYGQNVLIEGTVRQWCRMFKDGRTNVHDEERSGRPSVVSDDLVQSVDQKICERRRFTISGLSREFPHISRSVPCEIVTDRLGYHKFCARWVQQ
jgi:hypothetical protein